MSVSREQDRLVVGLFDEHYPELCRLAALLLDDDTEAEQVVREAFVRLFSGWRRFVYHDRAEWHLRAMVVAQARARLRRRSPQHRGSRMVARLNDRRMAKREGTEVSDTVEVLDAVDALSQAEREAVVFYYYLDMALAEIAGTLGSDVGKVREHLLNARKTLARLLAEADEARRPREPVEETRGTRQPRAVLTARKDDREELEPFAEDQHPVSDAPGESHG
jgi:RNA polymerase sigma factor (sigma-70 family)